jgi:hypothetical protein
VRRRRVESERQEGLRDVSVTVRRVGWRSGAALACTIAAAMAGPISVDRYQTEPTPTVASTVLAVVGLAFAWRAIWSGWREERLLGWPIGIALALLCLYMAYDRAGILLEWRRA